jgi:hypothetical protein
MPAVVPERLKKQIDHLINLFNTPKLFHRELQRIFEFYANRTLRMGDLISSQPLIPIYHLPDPVIQGVELSINQHLINEPLSGFPVADELWKDNFFEIRHLAGFTLGRITLHDPEPVCTRLVEWLTPELDQALTTDLLFFGTHTVRRDFPQVWEEFIESYLSQKDPLMIGLGLQGLRVSLQRYSETLLPSIFRMISPLMIDVDQNLSRELEHLLQAMAQVAPTETAFYVKQALSISESKGLYLLVKQTLPYFSDALQKEIRSALL